MIAVLSNLGADQMPHITPTCRITTPYLRLTKNARHQVAVKITPTVKCNTKTAIHLIIALFIRTMIFKTKHTLDSHLDHNVQNTKIFDQSPCHRSLSETASLSSGATATNLNVLVYQRNNFSKWLTQSMWLLFQVPKYNSFKKQHQSPVSSCKDIAFSHYLFHDILCSNMFFVGL